MTHPIRRARRAVTIAGLASALTLASLTAAGPASASAPNPFSCSGTRVVDVSAEFKNELDGGVSGKGWALLDIVEHARIWQETPTQFCVLETYTGTFNSFAGDSPGGTGTISANVTGVTLGSSRFELSATLHPVIPVSGYLGSFDFKCDQLGHCPGNIAFAPLYFTNITALFGSVYAELDISHGHGTWFQSGTTSLGDITG